MKKVIDADKMVCIEYFSKHNTKEIVKKYEELGKWEDVCLDVDGDLILWESLND